MCIFNADPNLSYVPEWLINYCMTKICYEEMVTIQKKAETIRDSIWAERIRMKPQFYGKINSLFNGEKQKDE